MHLKELKAKKPAELVAMAEELGVEGASTLRRQDIMFAILKEVAEDGEEIMGLGTIEVLTVRPRLTTPWLEAQLSDGTGKVTLIWMGRHEIAGVEAGRELLVNGRISDVDGERRIYNPAYTLL